MNVLCGLNCRNVQSETMCRSNIVSETINGVVPLFGALLPDILDQTTKMKQSAASFSRAVGPPTTASQSSRSTNMSQGFPFAVYCLAFTVVVFIACSFCAMVVYSI